MRPVLILTAAAGLAASIGPSAGAAPRAPPPAQEAPAPQYSASDFAKSMLSAPIPCTRQTEAQCQAEAKTRGFSLPTLSAKAVADRTGAARPATKARAKGAAAPAASQAAASPVKVLGGANVLVTFAPGSAKITPQGLVNLRSVAEGMKRPSLADRRFEIAGYTDPTGAPEANAALSKARAEAVMAALVGQGIEPARLTAAGYGSDPLVAPDAPTDEANRRVEVHRLD